MYLVSADKVELKDEYGNDYRREKNYNFAENCFRLDPNGYDGFTSGTITPSSLGPKEKVFFYVVGSKPVEKATRLEVTVLLDTTDGKASFSFSATIKRGDVRLMWHGNMPYTIGDEQIGDEQIGLRFITTFVVSPLYFREGAADEIARINAHVKRLDLVGSEATDVHLLGSEETEVGLKGLAGLKNLRNLKLSGPQVTDACLKDVAALENLESLYLWQMPVTDAGLKELAGLKSLRRLGLVFDPQVTDAGVAALRKELPKCQIEFQRR
jgi:hypothetical protein